MDVVPSPLELRLLVADVGDRDLVSRLLHFLSRILRCSVSAVIPGSTGFMPRSALSFVLSYDDINMATKAPFSCETLEGGLSYGRPCDTLCVRI